MNSNLHPNIRKFLILLLIIFLSACSDTSQVHQSEVPGTDVLPTNAPENELNGTEWVLLTIDGESLLENTNIAISFTDTHLSGFAGCNAFGGPYVVDRAGSFTIEEIASQAEGCIDPPGVLDQEITYLNALHNVVSYEINGTQLSFKDSSGESVLVYEQRIPSSMDPALLEDTAWQLLEIGGTPPKDGATINITLSQGKMSGHAGCRDYVGQYEADQDQIVFPAIEMLDEICENQTLLVQEGLFTESLSLATHYLLVDDQFELFLATGDSLLFKRSAEN